MFKKVSRAINRRFKKMRFWKRRKLQLEKSRLCVFRSSKHIQAQIIDDVKGFVIVSASSMEKGFDRTGKNGKEIAEMVGKIVAERALAKGVTSVIFDRNGYAYHGRIEKVADGARSQGLQF
jgi:large subunit ribosomal protein L18